MIHDKEDSLFRKPFFFETVSAYPSDSEPFKNDSNHRKNESINQDQTGNENRFIGKSIRQIQKADYEKKADKNGFDNRKDFLNNPDIAIDRIESLKRENDKHDEIARE